jgi:hypothetical protein
MRPSPRRSAQRRSRSAGAARWRRWKARHKRGRVLLQIEVDEYGLVEALIASDRLSADAALDRKRLVETLEHVVADFIAQWR